MNISLLAIVAEEPTADVRPERYSEWVEKTVRLNVENAVMHLNTRAIRIILTFAPVAALK